MYHCFHVSSVFRKLSSFGAKVKTFMEIAPNKQTEYNWQKINYKYYKINGKHPEKF